MQCSGVSLGSTGTFWASLLPVFLGTGLCFLEGAVRIRDGITVPDQPAGLQMCLFLQQSPQGKTQGPLGLPEHLHTVWTAVLCGEPPFWPPHPLLDEALELSLHVFTAGLCGMWVFFWDSAFGSGWTSFLRSRIEGTRPGRSHCMRVNVILVSGLTCCSDGKWCL